MADVLKTTTTRRHDEDDITRVTFSQIHFTCAVATRVIPSPSGEIHPDLRRREFTEQLVCVIYTFKRDLSSSILSVRGTVIRTEDNFLYVIRHERYTTG